MPNSRYEKLKSKIGNSETFKELESFLINNTSLSEKQSDKLISLIEQIHNDAVEIKKRMVETVSIH